MDTLALTLRPCMRPEQSEAPTNASDLRAAERASVPWDLRGGERDASEESGEGAPAGLPPLNTPTPAEDADSSLPLGAEASDFWLPPLNTPTPTEPASDTGDAAAPATAATEGPLLQQGLPSPLGLPPWTLQGLPPLTPQGVPPQGVPPPLTPPGGVPPPCTPGLPPPRTPVGLPPPRMLGVPPPLTPPGATPQGLPAPRTPPPRTPTLTAQQVHRAVALAACCAAPHLVWTLAHG